MLAQSRVIARAKRIRDVGKLVRTHGGKPSSWVKKASPSFKMAGRLYEYHWYECRGVGRVEVKRKQVDIR
jgi:hypothetical protein